MSASFGAQCLIQVHLVPTPPPLAITAQFFAVAVKPTVFRSVTIIMIIIGVVVIVIIIRPTALKLFHTHTAAASTTGGQAAVLPPSHFLHSCRNSDRPLDRGRDPRLIRGHGRLISPAGMVQCGAGAGPQTRVRAQQRAQQRQRPRAQRGLLRLRLRL